MKRKEIVLVKETRQNEFVKKVMEAISPHLNLKTSDKVAIKISLSGSREIYANTHYETVESMIFYLKEQFGISDISVIEGSDGAYYTGKTTWDIFYKFRYKEIELNGAKLVNLDDLPHDNTLEVNTLSGPRKVSYTTYDTDYLISIVPPKTHNLLPVCLTIPNLIGYVKPEDRNFVYGGSNSDLKKINSLKNERLFQLMENSGKNFAALLKAINPSMALIDGLYGMEGKGPIKGSPVFHGFAIASEDIVLADSLTTYIMGFEVDQVPYIVSSYKEGLGNNRWQNIIGVEPNHVKFPYRPHPFFQRQRLWKNQGQKDSGRGYRDKDRNFKDRPQKERQWDRDNRNRNDYPEKRDNQENGDRKEYKNHYDKRDFKERKVRERGGYYKRDRYQNDKSKDDRNNK